MSEPSAGAAARAADIARNQRACACTCVCVRARVRWCVSVCVCVCVFECVCMRPPSATPICLTRRVRVYNEPQAMRAHGSIAQAPSDGKARPTIDAAAGSPGLPPRPYPQLREPLGCYGRAQDLHTRPDGRSAGPAPTWQGRAQSRCRCGRGEPSPGADVGGVSPVPVKTSDETCTTSVQRPSAAIARTASSSAARTPSPLAAAPGRSASSSSAASGSTIVPSGRLATLTAKTRAPLGRDLFMVSAARLASLCNECGTCGLVGSIAVASSEPPPKTHVGGARALRVALQYKPWPVHARREHRRLGNWCRGSTARTV
jgi:hypothetical protein